MGFFAFAEKKYRQRLKQGKGANVHSTRECHGQGYWSAVRVGHQMYRLRIDLCGNRLDGGGFVLHEGLAVLWRSIRFAPSW
ncbi:MAG: hypothetical protein AMJ64_10555 [Betaproteobacteria bacterium SG8_39]|nr:MAG: hypothetical protein AMJ64_10555 [Betaproteobacteria bacterium SG8_39]